MRPSVIAAFRAACLLPAAALLCGLSPVRAQGTLQLPQTSAEVMIASTHRAALARMLAAPDAGKRLLPKPEEQVLLRALPPEMRRACQQMIRTWGEDPRNQPQWSVRLLHVERGEPLQGVLAFRCGSTSPAYAENADERPAVLSLDASAPRLRFFPLAERCEDCGSELYALRLSQRFPVPQGALVEVRSVWSNDNPALGVIEARGGERLHYILLPDAQLVLSLDAVRWFASHDDEQGDTQGKCEVRLRYLRDAAGRLTGIVPSGPCRLAVDAVPAPVRHYVWNAARRAFDDSNLR